MITAESIRRSIEQNLRRPEKNEERISGTIQKIECSLSEVDFQVLSGGKTYKFARGVPRTGGHGLVHGRLVTASGRLRKRSACIERDTNVFAIYKFCRC